MYKEDAAGHSPTAPDGSGRGTLVFDVEGMHCASCVTRVEKALSAQPGVAEASADLLTRTARVRLAHRPPAADPTRALMEAAAGAGYPLTLRRRNDGPSSPQARDRKERRRYGRLFAAAAALAVPTAFLGMFLPDPAWSRAAQAVLSGAAVWGTGLVFHKTTWTRLRRGGVGMDALITLGSSAAWFYSAARAPSGEPVFFETAAVIVAFVLLGRYLEARVKARAAQAVENLVEWETWDALVLRDGEWHPLPCRLIRVGDKTSVSPGARIPVDGVIIEGSGEVDESMLTGESRPVPRTVGDPVIGGSVNHAGRLVVEATAVGEDSTAARIARLVDEARASKAPVQRLADRVSAVFIPVVIGLASLTLLWWMLRADPATAVRNATAVLIIACPCALGLATPAAITAVCGRGAELGIIFRSAEVLERMRKLDLAAFDKTGTLTTGRMTLTAVEHDPAHPDFLAAMAGVEQAAGHPIGAAVAEGSRKRGVVPAAAQDVTAFPGRGAEGTVEGRRVTVGSPEFMEQRGIVVGDRWKEVLESARRRGETAFAGAWEGKVRGVAAVRDRPRPGADRVLAALRKRGMETAMLTGDHPLPARRVAGELDVEKVHARLLPEDKARLIEQWRAQGRAVAYVGDGINDAPALAAAAVGMGVGTGTGMAVEAAPVTLMSGNPAQVIHALDLADRALRGIRWNLGWAFFYNTAALPLAAAGLLNPMAAAAAMALSSVSVVANSLRIRNWSPAPLPGAADIGAPGR